MPMQPIAYGARRGARPVKNKRFSTILKDDFGIGTGRKNAGRFYVGLAAKPAALKLVSND